jgi:acetolactate synthase-1/2/3 large subunit
LLLSLVERLQLPVAMTLHGLGGFPGDHRLSLGLLGMHGLYAANQAVQNAEVILAVGMRFDDRVTGRLAEFAPKAKIIHIDIDHSEFHKNVPAHISLHGDASVVL